MVLSIKKSLKRVRVKSYLGNEEFLKEGILEYYYRKLWSDFETCENQLVMIRTMLKTPLQKSCPDR